MNETPCKVLVVDVERNDADSNVSLLQLWGHEAEAAYSPEDALAKAVALDPDVILMDLEPVASGFDLAKELRKSCPEAKLLALTDYTRADIVRRARSVGVDRVLEKPVPAKAIKEAVDASCATVSVD
jgi:two-component system nitrate/nitrite response regulator NarL